MKSARIVLPLAALTLLLVSCGNKEPEVMSHDDGNAGSEAASSMPVLSLEEKAAESGEVAFAIRSDDQVFTDFGIGHTKEMHFIVVREDLQYFEHLHPERDAEGVWRVSYTPSAGGVYWMYADFIDADGKGSTLRFTKLYPGMPGSTDFSSNFEHEQIVDGYKFVLHPTVSDSAVSFAYEIMNAEGNTVEVEEYLGASGHSILLTLGGDFIHTHASKDAGQPAFEVLGLRPGTFYRIFTQFKINGEVELVTFDWES